MALCAAFPDLAIMDFQEGLVHDEVSFWRLLWRPGSDADPLEGIAGPGPLQPIEEALRQLRTGPMDCADEALYRMYVESGHLESMRISAARSLAAQGTALEEVTDVLFEMLDDVGNSSAHRSWRSAAAELLGRLSSRVSGVSPRLGERLGAPDRWLRLFATLALRCFRSPDRNLVRLAEKVARDEWPRIRLATVRAVARAHSESGDVTRLLDTFADDDDPMVRGDAVWALRMRSEQNRS